jgi:4-carboxymuconolactone decarboxylase
MTDVRETGLNVFRELMPGLLPDGEANFRSVGFGDELFEICIDNVFGRLWGVRVSAAAIAASSRWAC